MNRHYFPCVSPLAQLPAGFTCCRAGFQVLTRDTRKIGVPRAVEGLQSRCARVRAPVYERGEVNIVARLKCVLIRYLQAIETLSRHSFEGNSLTTSREALRCLANTFLLQPPTRQLFVDGGYATKATERLKVGAASKILAEARNTGLMMGQVDNRDDEFLISRILFLMTYDTTLDFDQLNAEHQLADSINKVRTPSCSRCHRLADRISECRTSRQAVLEIDQKSVHARSYERDGSD